MATIAETNTTSSVFLDKNVCPTIYNITWDVDLDSQIITAFGDIEFDIKGSGVEILKLHALDLNIDKSSVTWTSASSPNGAAQILKGDITYENLFNIAEEDNMQLAERRFQLRSTCWDISPSSRTCRTKWHSNKTP